LFDNITFHLNHSHFGAAQGSVAGHEPDEGAREEVMFGFHQTLK